MCLDIVNTNYKRNKFAYQSVVVSNWLMTPETIGPRMIALP
jgi:hypothetical protein